METGKKRPTEWVEASNRFGRAGKNRMIELKFKAVRDERMKLRFEITVPNADEIVLPDDLGVLLQCFGWGMAGLGYRLSDTPHDTFHGCCEVMWEVDAFLGLV